MNSTPATKKYATEHFSIITKIEMLSLENK